MKIIRTALLIIALGVSANAASPFESSNSKAPIQIDADSLEVLQNQKKAIFSGNVIAKQAGMTLKAQRMTVYYSGGDAKSAGPGKAISKIDVEGSVFLATAQETARGDSGNYDVVNDFVTLNGNVVLTRQNNVLKGSSLQYDIKNGRSKLIGGVSTTGGGRVQGLFVPENKQ